MSGLVWLSPFPFKKHGGLHLFFHPSLTYQESRDVSPKQSCSSPWHGVFSSSFCGIVSPCTRFLTPFRSTPAVWVIKVLGVYVRRLLCSGMSIKVHTATDNPQDNTPHEINIRIEFFLIGEGVGGGFTTKLPALKITSSRSFQRRIAGHFHYPRFREQLNVEFRSTDVGYSCMLHRYVLYTAKKRLVLRRWPGLSSAKPASVSRR